MLTLIFLLHMDTTEDDEDHSPLKNALPGTTEVIKHLVNIYHLTSRTMHTSLWVYLEQGQAILLDTDVLGIYLFGLWSITNRVFIMKRAVQATQILPYPKELLAFTVASGYPGNERYFAFVFRRPEPAAIFMNTFVECTGSTLLRHSLSTSNISARDADNGLNTEPITINPKQSSLWGPHPVQYLETFESFAPTSINVTESTSLKKYLDPFIKIFNSKSDSDEENENFYSTIGRLRARIEQLQIKVINTKSGRGKNKRPSFNVLCVKNNLSMILEAFKDSPKILVIIRDKNLDSEKTFIVKGKFSTEEEAKKIAELFHTEKVLQGIPKIKNKPKENILIGIVHTITDQLLIKLEANPRLQVLELEVDSFTHQERMNILKKNNKSCLYKDPKTGSVLRDYPQCLDLDCMYSKKEPFERDMIKPKEILKSLSFESSSKVAESDIKTILTQGPSISENSNPITRFAEETELEDNGNEVKESESWSETLHRVKSSFSQNSEPIVIKVYSAGTHEFYRKILHHTVKPDDTDSDKLFTWFEAPEFGTRSNNVVCKNTCPLLNMERVSIENKSKNFNKEENSEEKPKTKKSKQKKFQVSPAPNCPNLASDKIQQARLDAKLTAMANKNELHMRRTGTPATRGFKFDIKNIKITKPARIAPYKPSSKEKLEPTTTRASDLMLHLRSTPSLESCTSFPTKTDETKISRTKKSPNNCERDQFKTLNK